MCSSADQVDKARSKGKILLIIGFVSIGILFLIYSRYENPELTPDAIPSIERLSVMFYVAILLSFSAIAFGLYKYHKQKVIETSDVPTKK